MSKRFLIISAIVLISGTFADCLEFQDERRDSNYNWRNTDDLFGLFGPQPLYPKSQNRRTAESIDSSEEETPQLDANSNSPLDIDMISGSIGGHNGGDGDFEVETHQRPSPPHSINPFFGNPFFNVFGFGHSAPGGFGLFPGFDVPQSIPWWKGPNVCTERKEELSEWDSSPSSTSSPSSNESSEEEKALRKTTAQSHFGVHISFNSCVEKSNKRVCKTIIDENGRKKTTAITHQCCRGFGRKKSSRSSNIFMPCEELHLRSMVETSEKLNGREFIRSAQKNFVEDNLRKNVTIFLPTDATFTEFAEQLLESNLVVMPESRARRATEVSGFTTKGIILNHIVPELVSIEDIENEQLLVTEYENATIRMNIFPRPRGSRDDDNDYPYRYTANCAPLSKIDQEAENGIIHVVDRVLTPVTKSIMEMIRERSDMAVLQTVLEKTELAKDLSNAEKQFTLFAPTDSAFEKLDPQMRRKIKEGKGCALNLIKNHILDMTFCSVAVVNDAKTSAINSLGEKMNLERIEASKIDRSESSETEALADVKSIFINNISKITETDLMATNGVIQVIDTLLPTESAMPITSMLDSRNLTLFKQLIEMNGIVDQIDSAANVTVFAPTNSALESNYWVKKIEMEPETLKGNEELTKFLQYHIAKPLIKTCDLTERSLDTETGDKVRVNLYSTHTIFSNVFNRATVNCARLVHFDDDSCGSVLHQVDRPLDPPSQNILEVLESNENYSTFVNLIKKANLTSLLQNETSSLTILVPKNDVFTEVKEYFDELNGENNREELTNLIKSHIIDDVLCCAGIVPSEWPFVRLVKTINNVDLKLTRDRRPKIQNAGVTRCDIIAKNGIVHEINDVVNTKQQRRTPQRPVESDDISDDPASKSSFFPNFLTFP